MTQRIFPISPDYNLVNIWPETCLPKVAMDDANEGDNINFRVLGNLGHHPKLARFKESPSMESLRAFKLGFSKSVAQFVRISSAPPGTLTPSLDELWKHLFRAEGMSIRTTVMKLAILGESKAYSFRTLEVEEHHRQIQLQRPGAVGNSPVPSLAEQIARR